MNIRNKHLGFIIEDIETFHVILNSSPSYWEDTNSNKVIRETNRFELRENWQTIYAKKPECLILKIILRNGSIGWGEANVPIGPEVVKLILDNILIPLVKGEKFNSPNHMWEFLYSIQRGRGYHSGYYLDALAALDIAVWDAISRSHNLPLAKLLRNNPTTVLPIYLSGLRQKSTEEKISHLKKWCSTGLQGVKLFLPANNEKIIEELSTIQTKVPEMKNWMIDLLWMSNIESCIKLKLQLCDFNVNFLECPLQPEDLEGHKSLVDNPGVPIALGEHFRTHFQIKNWLTAPALNVLQTDIGRTGISNGLKQLEMSFESGIQITPHMGMGSPIFQAATLHFSSICESPYLQEYQAGLADSLKQLVKTYWIYDNGYLHMPDIPGLGIEVDEINIINNSVKI